MEARGRPLRTLARNRRRGIRQPRCSEAAPTVAISGGVEPGNGGVSLVPRCSIRASRLPGPCRALEPSVHRARGEASPHHYRRASSLDRIVAMLVAYGAGYQRLAKAMSSSVATSRIARHRRTTTYSRGDSPQVPSKQLLGLEPPVEGACRVRTRRSSSLARAERAGSTARTRRTTHNCFTIAREPRGADRRRVPARGCVLPRRSGASPPAGRACRRARGPISKHATRAHQ